MIYRKEYELQGVISKYDLVIYPFELVVAVGDVADKIQEQYKTKTGLIETDNDMIAQTQTCYNKDTNRRCELVWFRDSESFTVKAIAHEATHAAMDIFRSIGIFEDLDNQEPLTYLVGAVADFCHKTLKEYYDTEEKVAEQFKRAQEVEAKHNK